MPQPQGGIENMKKRNWNEKRKFCILGNSAMNFHLLIKNYRGRREYMEEKRLLFLE